jgi:predicted secreted protein
MAQTTTFLNGTTHKIEIGGVLLGYTKDASVSVSKNIIDTSNKDSGAWSTSLGGRNSFTISGSALLRYDATKGAAEMFADIVAGTELAVKVTNSNTGDNEFAGTVIVNSWEISFPDDDVVEYSFEMTGTGAATFAVQA